MELYKLPHIVKIEKRNLPNFKLSIVSKTLLFSSFMLHCILIKCIKFCIKEIDGSTNRLSYYMLYINVHTTLITGGYFQ